MLVVLPFVIDLGGNALDLYDRYGWFDDLAHALNWAILTTAFGLALRSAALPRWAATGLALGFGATTHVLWELSEYLVTRLSGSDLHLTYEDTIGDLALSLCGSVAGAAITAALVTRAARPTASAPRAAGP